MDKHASLFNLFPVLSRFFEKRPPGFDWKRTLFGYQIYWAFQILGWFGAAVSEILISFLHEESSVLEIGFTFFGACLGIFITHLLRIVIHWQNWLNWSSRKQMLWSVVACIPASVIYMLCFFPLVWDLDPYKVKTIGMLPVLGSMFFWTYGPLLLWCGLYFGWQYLRKYQHATLERVHLDRALKEAELRALRAQLNPHFLFNALNSVRALVESDPTRAREAVTLLANLLRATLHSSEQETVTLAKELKTVQDYLSLEHIRFEDRLKVQYDIEPTIIEHCVPAFCLQSLVENAVKHGISHSMEGGLIHISASKVETGLRLKVINEPGFLIKQSQESGIGLKNLHERLQLLFGEASTLSLYSSVSSVTAEIHLPEI